MIRLKNEKQIDGIRTSCKMLSAMYRELIPLVKPGVQTIEIDQWVQTWIKKAGGRPVFLGYGPAKNPFPAAICKSRSPALTAAMPRYKHSLVAAFRPCTSLLALPASMLRA